MAEARTHAATLDFFIVVAASHAAHALHYQEASGQASANCPQGPNDARSMWERPQGRGAFLVISLETSFTRGIRDKRRMGGFLTFAYWIGKVSRFCGTGGERKLFVLRKSYNVRKEGPHIIIRSFGKEFVGVSVRK